MTPKSVRRSQTRYVAKVRQPDGTKKEESYPLTKPLSPSDVQKRTRDEKKQTQYEDHTEKAAKVVLPTLKQQIANRRKQGGA